MIAGLASGTGLTLANYTLACALCLAAARRSGRSSEVWAGLAGIVLLLLVNKGWGIETQVAAVGRVLAKTDGLYETRRLYQAAAIATMLGLLPYGLREVWQRCRRHAFPLQLAAACLTLLVAFIAARALSFHYLDKLLALGPSVIKLNGLIENALVCGLATTAILALRPGAVWQVHQTAGQVR